MSSRGDENAYLMPCGIIFIIPKKKSSSIVHAIYYGVPLRTKIRTIIFQSKSNISNSKSNISNSKSNI